MNTSVSEVGRESKPNCQHSTDESEKSPEQFQNASSFLIVSPTPEFEDSVEEAFLQKLSIVKCTSCDKSVALILQDKCFSIWSLLSDQTKSDGWSMVSTEKDQLSLYILNQIVYKEYEVPDENLLQSIYAFPPSTDCRKLLWIKGKCVGFYTAKPKGSLDADCLEWYRMTVLDTLFIRHSQRRKGFAMSALQDLLQEFPDQNIGFSCPISIPMIQVLKKHLAGSPKERMRFWEIEGCALEGCCQLLWFSLNRR